MSSCQNPGRKEKTYLGSVTEENVLEGLFTKMQARIRDYSKAQGLETIIYFYCLYA